MRIVLATTNPHKLDEIREVFAAQAADGDGGRAIDLVGLDRFDPIEEPVEDQDTFEGNALLKARYYARAAEMACLADDSGLEVDALGGAPGVISARYAGAAGARDVVDPANNRKLLAELGDLPAGERTARFVCVMALCAPRGEEEETLAVVRGTVEGRILTPDETTDADCPERGRGDNGFGYDPLFLVPDLGRTTAELSPEHKNRISHRGDASRKMWAAIQAACQ
ncbi:MAG: non-canonical purine NTP pyrophosphatase [Phycisphaeraceae bacterium]|nr:non-canonical purine NTP pyrophosphatase [Phycisphaeraceae bacterium]